METCKVEFTNDTGQKIILDFTLDDKGNLEYNPSFEPKITDLKTNLGFCGQLCEIFLTALINKANADKCQRDDKQKRKLES
uniref:Uncharacterized protein n=1 Tax=CrAss-like virus sp. ctYsL76 TaxID=2826826 RepID=A0A8S5QM66_9CAUD|nr:MAG TPA: hypothetical protein [CrAss-like virus sp. ctYsL76]